MPVLEPDSSFGEKKNWRLTCDDDAILKSYWKIFQQVYRSEMDCDEIPAYYNAVEPEYMMGQMAPLRYSVIFRTKGTPSFAAILPPPHPTQQG